MRGVNTLHAGCGLCEKWLLVAAGFRHGNYEFFFSAMRDHVSTRLHALLVVTAYSEAPEPSTLPFCQYMLPSFSPFGFVPYLDSSTMYPTAVKGSHPTVGFFQHYEMAITNCSLSSSSAVIVAPQCDYKLISGRHPSVRARG